MKCVSSLTPQITVHYLPSHPIRHFPLREARTGMLGSSDVRTRPLIGAD